MQPRRRDDGLTEAAMKASRRHAQPRDVRAPSAAEKRRRFLGPYGGLALCAGARHTSEASMPHISGCRRNGWFDVATDQRQPMVAAAEHPGHPSYRAPHVRIGPGALLEMSS